MLLRLFITFKKKTSIRLFDETLNLTMNSRTILTFVLCTCSSTSMVNEYSNNLESLVPNVSKSQLQNENQHQSIQSLPINGFSPSPKCWTNAISVFHSERTIQEAKDIKSLCASLPESHQKLLALEIASCHLVDLGKELYRDDGLRDVCMRLLNGDYERKLTVCLKQLTDTGENAYTVYITYVQNMCIRLTQELVLLNLEESRQIALEHYREASVESINNMKAIKDLSQLYKEQVIQLTSIPSKISEELSVDLNNYLKDIVEESMRSLTIKQANDHGTIIETLIKRVEERDEANQERFEEWSEYLISLWQRQAVVMHQYHDTITEHHRQMDSLHEAVNATNNSMRYLNSLQFLGHLVIVGYKWSSSLFYLACTILMTAILTNALSCSGRWMYHIAFLEFLLEILLSATERFNAKSKWSAIICIPILRRWTIVVELYTLASSVFAKFATQRPTARNQRNRFRAHSSLMIARKIRKLNKTQHRQYSPITTSENNATHVSAHLQGTHLDRIRPTQQPTVNDATSNTESSNRINSSRFRTVLSNESVTNSMDTSARIGVPISVFRDQSMLMNTNSFSVDDYAYVTNVDTTPLSNKEIHPTNTETKYQYHMEIEPAPIQNSPSGEGNITKRIALDPPEQMLAAKRHKLNG